MAELAKEMGMKEGNILICDIGDTVELAKQYGTPLYVIDEDFLRKNCAFPFVFSLNRKKYEFFRISSCKNACPVI